uniref:Mitochondrial import receptor subunit TOM22 homolog n=1 Tax=Parascaris univalens TaxID=6257 RepID=A0A915BYH5_PARUN
MAYEGIIGGDEWDQIPDDELDETIAERLWGLTEMFPESLRRGVGASVNWSIWAAKSSFSLAKSAIWIVATTSVIMFLPYIIEKERSDLEKSQLAQQRQMLLGPTAAVNAAKH